MLKVIVPSFEVYDEKQNLFITVKECRLSLEHSLVSISKWESIYQKPFLRSKNKTTAEVLEYIKCMTLTQNVDPLIYSNLPSDVIKQITDYIAAPMTATTFSKKEEQHGRKEIVTSELIYYWMVAYQIPFECEKWHINRLLTLIRICAIKNEPPKKMSKADVMRNNAALNAKRRAALHSKG